MAPHADSNLNRLLFLARDIGQNHDERSTDAETLRMPAGRPISVVRR